MGWSLWLEAEGFDTWGGVAYASGTHNVNPMVRDAGFAEWPYGLSGMAAGEFADRLHLVMVEWDRDPGRFRAMNPANGWGDFDQLRRELVPFAVECRRSPAARIVCSA